jgi:hypothetical protein
MAFQKLDLVPFSDEGGDTNSLGPLERADLSHSIMLCSLIFRIQKMGEVQISCNSESTA